MKNVRLMVLATIAMVFMGVANLSAQEQDQQTVIIRVFEFVMGRSKMYVTQPNGDNVIVQLESPRNIDEAYPKNDAILQTQINSWKKLGFNVNGMTSYPSNHAQVTVIILTKD
ncbi:MAG: hypothetical protein ABI207_06955 [Crocinitomicaceae bacterium]